MVKKIKKKKPTPVENMAGRQEVEVEEPVAVETKAEAPKISGGDNTFKILLGCCLGCLLIVILVVAGSLVTGGLLLKNIGIPFLKKAGQEVQKEIKKQEGLKQLEKGRNIFEQIPTIGGRLKIEEEGTTLPKNFPPNFPIYPGAKVTQARSAEVEGKSGFFVNLETDELLSTVVDYYKVSLSKAGWTISATFGNEKGTFLTVQKPPQNGLVTISEKEGKTQINIVLGEK